MKPRTPAEELIADTLAKALMGQLTVGPLDMMRLAAAAREVDSRRIAELAIERWLTTDPRAIELIRIFARRFSRLPGVAQPSDCMSPQS
jgi:hypothetical protein